MKTKGLKNDFITESTAFFYYQFDIIIKKGRNFGKKCDAFGAIPGQKFRKCQNIANNDLMDFTATIRLREL